MFENARALATSWVALAALVASATDAPSDIPPVEEVLANPLDDAAYVDEVRCLGTARYRRVHIVGDRVLVFQGRGKQAWVNILPRRCHGLRRDMVLSIEVRGARVCNRDHFRGVPRLSREAGTAFCTLGAFRPVDTDNLDAIRGALSAREANTTVARTVRPAASKRTP